MKRETKTAKASSNGAPLKAVEASPPKENGNNHIERAQIAAQLSQHERRRGMLREQYRQLLENKQQLEAAMLREDGAIASLTGLLAPAQAAPAPQ